MNIEENDLTEQTIRAVWAIAGGTGVVALMAILNRLSINDDELICGSEIQERLS